MCGEQDGNQGVADTVPTPIVIIDQDSDPDATVVEITFGDRLGALLDTVSIYLNKSIGAPSFYTSLYSTDTSIECVFTVLCVSTQFQSMSMFHNIYTALHMYVSISISYI